MCQISWIKAFDRLDWYFVLSALYIFEYVDKFIQSSEGKVNKIYTGTEWDTFWEIRR